MKKRHDALKKSLLTITISALLAPTTTFGNGICADLYSKSRDVMQISKLEGEIPKDIISFEDAYNVGFAKEMAEKDLYIRRPTASEIEKAIQNKTFPDTPEVRTGLMVIQEGKLDYKSSGKLVLAHGNYKIEKWNESLDFEATSRSMKSQIEKGAIVGEISLAQYKNALSDLSGTSTNVGGNKADRIMLITLANGTRGVFKSLNIHQAVAEMASYLFARSLGIKLVPPTVIVNHRGQLGSFQYFIENPATGINKQHGAKSEDLISAQDKADMEIFYIGSGNWDAHPGNRIIDINGGLGLIDNEAITRPQFYRYGELPWFALMQKGKTDKVDFLAPESDAFPFDQGQFFNKPTVEKLFPLIKEGGYDLELLKSKLLWYDQDSGRIGVINWQGSLWFQLNVPEFYRPRIPGFFPESTMQKAQTLSIEDLRAIFQTPFVEYGGQNVFKDTDLRRIKSRIEELVREWNRKKTN